MVEEENPMPQTLTFISIRSPVGRIAIEIQRGDTLFGRHYCDSYNNGYSSPMKFLSPTDELSLFFCGNCGLRITLNGRKLRDLLFIKDYAGVESSLRGEIEQFGSSIITACSC